jgi:hypothetical protein
MRSASQERTLNGSQASGHPGIYLPHITSASMSKTDPPQDDRIEIAQSYGSELDSDSCSNSKSPTIDQSGSADIEELSKPGNHYYSRLHMQ